MAWKIEVNKLRTVFGKHIVHDNLSCIIESGQIVGIVGASGSGKSLLLRYIMGLSQPQSGTINFPKDLTYGVLFQHGALFSSLTSIENIMVPLLEQGLKKSMAYEIALFKLQQVGLNEHAANQYPARLSGGMIKRVALARAMALDPQLLLLDEPTAGLDPIAADSFDELVLKLHKELCVTVILVTHDLDTLKNTCNTIGVLLEQKLYLDTVDKIIQIQHPWLQEYFLGRRGAKLFYGDHN